MSTRDHTLNCIMTFTMLLAAVLIVACTLQSPEAERTPGYVVALICAFVGLACAHDNFAVAVREEEDNRD